MAAANEDKEPTVGALQALISPFVDFKAICQRQLQPQHCTLLHFRNWLRLCGLLPLRSDGDDDGGSYRFGNALLLFAQALMALSVTADLYVARHSIVAFGDDLVMLLGLYLIWIKQMLYRQRANVLQDIVLEIDALHRSNMRLARRQSQVHQQVCALQRIFYMVEMGAYTGYLLLGIVLVAALCLHPFVTEEPLPMRCHYPFALQQQSQCRRVIYVLQCLYLAYNICAVLQIDSLACTFCTQIAVGLRILCIRLRSLGLEPDQEKEKEGGQRWQQLRAIVLSYQQLISLVERINDCLYWGYVAQMGASTFIICLAAFEALLAQDQPLVAIKFQVYMFTAFMQLFYWCLIGNIMYFDSMEVATAAFELHCWYDESPALQRNLMFIIQRAQKPLLLQPKPLFGFNFATFVNILSTSYSYFTLLRTMNE